MITDVKYITKNELLTEHEQRIEMLEHKFTKQAELIAEHAKKFGIFEDMLGLVSNIVEEASKNIKKNDEKNKKSEQEL